jgi:hypothetical protein
MASCSRCGADTQLYSNRTPICLTCAETAPIPSGQDEPRTRMLTRSESDMNTDYNQSGGTLAP